MTRKPLIQKDFRFSKWIPADISIIPSIAIAAIKNNIEDIKKIEKEERTFENTILAFENGDREVSDSVSNIHILEMVSDKKEVRDACRIASIEFQEKIVDLNHDIELYKAIKDYYEGNYKKEKKNLKSEDIKLVEDYVKSFKRMGFDLSVKDRNKLKSIEKKISKLANNYDARLAEDNSYILCNENEMEGIPEMVKNSFERIKKENSPFYKVGVSYPEYGPFMKYSNSREKRKELYLKFNNQGGEKNVKMLQELAELRKQKAAMLGYKNHAEYVISDRMAGKVDVVYKMLSNILKNIGPKKKEEIKNLKLEGEKLGIKKLEVSDVDFVTNKIRESKYGIDEQKQREYFPLDHVMNEMCDLFGNLFGFKVNRTNLKLWHKDAFLCEIIDKKSKKLIGYIAFDLFPREGKFGHACMMPTRSGYVVEGDTYNYNTPFSTIVCNFSKPKNKIGSKNYIPSLLTIGEVETLFHEFGHALHHVMTSAKYESQSGTSVLWDFVEAPSQIMEEWLLEEKVLKKMSRHYKTGKSLPKSEIDNIVGVSKFMKGTFYTRQALQGLLDLDLYTEKTSQPVEHFHNLMKEHLYEVPGEVLFVSKFAHIARGYDAGYYSYLWAERIEKDLYSKFKEVENNKLEYQKIGDRYRKEILEVGSSREESDSVKKFLGREVSNEAFVKSLE